MKMFLLVSFMLTAVQAQGNDTSALTKSQDGLAVYCETETDLGTFAIRPTASSVTTTDGGLDIGFSLEALVCVKNGANYEFGPRPFGAPVEFLTKSGMKAIQHTQYSEMLLVNNQIDLIGSQPMNLNSSKQDFLFSVNFKDVLTAEQLKSYEAGKIVNTSVEFFIRSKCSIELESKTVSQSGCTSGAYRIHFVLKQEPSTRKLQASEAQLSN